MLVNKPPTGSIHGCLAVMLLVAGLPIICVCRCRSLHVSPLAPLLCLCVTLAAGAGCGVLLCWHLYLIATGQTTLEFYAARKSAKAATAEGHKLVRIHDLGLKENFKVGVVSQPAIHANLMILERSLLGAVPNQTRSGQGCYILPDQY